IEATWNDKAPKNIKSTLYLDITFALVSRTPKNKYALRAAPGVVPLPDEVKPSGGKPSGAAAADANGAPPGPTSGGASGGAGPSSLAARKATAATAAGPKPKDAAGP
ncbi:hypothetical protein DUNSADRAFT_5958, partial [Dunaliella salina]